MVDDILTVDTFSTEATERNATVDEFVRAGKLKQSAQKVVYLILKDNYESLLEALQKN